MPLGPQSAVRALGVSLGAEVTGFDVKTIAARGLLGAVKDLLFQHQVLVFRDQHLEPDDLERFTRLFGEPDPHVLQQYTLPGHPDIFVISNIVENGKSLGSRFEGFGWHTDLSYLERPAGYTLLYGLEVPSEGADTLFTSLYRVYDALPDERRSALRGLWATYSYAKLYYRRPSPAPLTAEQRARTPDVTHPLVRVHPETGREGLYINRDDFLCVEEMDGAAGQELLDELFDMALEERFVYRHKWQVRDLVIWDNRGALHTATPFDMEKHRRLLYRMTVLGEKPVGCADTTGRIPNETQASSA